MLLQVFCLALTKDINLLETKKYDNSVDAIDILTMEKEVSQRYLFLAEVLSSHPDLERECILTAFSMNPTAEFFELVCTLAERRHQVNHDRTQANAGQLGHVANANNGIDEVQTAEIGLSTEFIDALHVITGGTQILESKDYDAEVAPSRLIDELTMLSESVRHDLTCMLSVTRIKNLTWLTPWHKLKEECAQLLENEEKKRIVEKTTAAANTKLQYLKLNYDEFKDFKPHEYPGIEKGYEMYVPDTSSDESILRSDRDSDETDTAPESKLYKKREARRLSDKKRRQVRRRKQILKQLEDDDESNENGARIIDTEKKKKAIQNMLNVTTGRGTSRPRRPGPSRPRKKKVKVEPIEEKNCEHAVAMANVLSEGVKTELIVTEQLQEQPLQEILQEQPLQEQMQIQLQEQLRDQQITEALIAVESAPTEEETRQFAVHQNVLQAVSNILGDAPNLMSTTGIELLEEIIGTKPEANDICLEDLFDPETGALTIDATEVVNEKDPEMPLTNVEPSANGIEQIDGASRVIEQTTRKRLSSSSNDDMACTKRRLSDCAVAAQIDERTLSQGFSYDLSRPNDTYPVTQNGNNFLTESTADAYSMWETTNVNEINTELIQSASIDRIENSNSQLKLDFDPTKMPSDIGVIDLPPLPSYHVLVPQVDTPNIPVHLLHLPLLPVATSPPTKEKPRNPLLAFRKQRKCTPSPAHGSFFSSMNLDVIDGEDHSSINLPTDQMFIGTRIDPVPIARRDSFSAVSSSSGDHTSDSMLTAASNGPEILTKHCMVSLRRIEDDKTLLRYLQRDSSVSPTEYHRDSEPLHNEDDSNCRQIFLGNSLQPLVVLKQIQLVSNKCDSICDKRTINGCNSDTMTESVGDDSNVLREIKQNVQASPTSASLNGNAVSMAVDNNNSSSDANSNSNNSKNHKNNNEEDDDDDDGRKSVEMDNYGAMNNHNGYHNPDDDDERGGRERGAREEQKKSSKTNNNGNGGNGTGGDSSGQQQQQRCHQQTPQGKSQSQQLERDVIDTNAVFRWNFVAAPATELRQMTEVR